MKHQLRWFEKRIGKRIFRNKALCGCVTCTDVTHNGLVVKDKQHAHYLHLVQNDLDLDYQDKNPKA